jgi:hypothetical protein
MYGQPPVGRLHEGWRRCRDKIAGVNSACALASDGDSP